MADLKLIDPANWMADIGDDVYLETINIPGTHDSAAINTSIHTPYACHYKTLTEQMSEGIRFFDLRIKVKDKLPGGYKFVTCHGDTGSSFGINEYQSLRSALDEFKNYLNIHSKEALILSVKIDDWNGYENDAINILPGLYWWFGTWFQTVKLDIQPKMRDVRGKVCLLNRVSGYESAFGPKAVWPDATPFDQSTIGSTRFIVQDKYKDLASDQEKCDLVFNLMKQHQSNGIALNFTSAITDVLTGVYIAPLLLNKLGETAGSQRIKDFGWILFDYEDSKYSTSNYGEITVIDLILDSNFNYEKFQGKFEISD